MSSKIRNGLSFFLWNYSDFYKISSGKMAQAILVSNSVSFYSSETAKMNPYFQIREDYSSYELPMNKEVK